MERDHSYQGEAATWAGNSPNVIHRHYKVLMKEADTTAFWNLTPSTVRSEIVKLPAKAAA
jgi:hypothetical protein